MDKWNVALQHELPWGVALEVAYVGNDQIHQTSEPHANACPNLGTTNSNITCQSLQPIPYIGQGSIVVSNG